MADEAIIEDDELDPVDPDEEDETEEDEPETTEGDDEADPEDEPEGEGEADEDEEVVISFDGDGEDEEEAKLDEKGKSILAKVRQREREAQKELRALKKQLSEVAPKEEEKIPPRPTLESVGFDREKYDTALLEWHEKNRAAEDRKKAREEEEAKALEAHQARVNAHRQKAESLKLPDYQETEDQVVATLKEPWQQQAILDLFENSPEVFYALGKSPKRLEALAGEKNIFKFSVALAELGRAVKVERRKPVQTERRVRSGKPPVSSAENLDALKRKAQRTGDYSEYFAAKRKAG